MSKAKQKGTAFETAVTSYLQENDIDARRLPLTGSKDQGDIRVCGQVSFTLEAKNHRAMDLSTWMNQVVIENTQAGTDFGIVVHKRPRRGDVADSYVTMSLDTFTSLLKLLK